MDGLPKDFRNTINQIEQDHQAVLKSTLSPLACEFVPRFVVNSSAQVNQSSAISACLGSNDSYQNYAYQQNNPTNVMVSELSIDDPEQDDFIALNQLRDFMDTIAENPAEYETLLPQITEVLNHWTSEDPDIILHCVVNNIVDRVCLHMFRFHRLPLTCIWLMFD